MYKNYKNPVARSSYLKKYRIEWARKNKSSIGDYMRNYMKAYRLKNKEKISLSRKRYSDKNTLSSQKYRKEYRKTVHARYSKYKYGATKRGYVFEINFKFFNELINSDCHYCGSVDSIGIDRKDNTLGYSKDNCLSCCTSCNMMKRGLDYDYFINKCKSISYFVVKAGVGD